MSEKRSIILVRRFLWYLLLLAIVGILLPPYTSGSLKATLRDWSSWRMWELVGLPFLVGGGLLVTLLQTLVFEPLQRRKNQKHQSDRQ